MNWFGPSGDCGCCACENIDCETRIESGETIRTFDGVDLLACECVSIFTNEVILRTDFSMTFQLTGTATGVSVSGIWGGPTTPTSVDLTGSYSHNVTYEAKADGSCGRVAGDGHWLTLHSQYLGTAIGNDYYSVVSINTETLAIGADVVFVTTGNPVPTTGLVLSAQTIGSSTITWCDSACGCTYRVIPYSLYDYLSTPYVYDFNSIYAEGSQDNYLGL
jgi:hypothetical protein